LECWGGFYARRAEKNCGLRDERKKRGLKNTRPKRSKQRILLNPKNMKIEGGVLKAGTPRKKQSNSKEKAKKKKKEMSQERE